MLHPDWQGAESNSMPGVPTFERYLHAKNCEDKGASDDNVRHESIKSAVDICDVAAHDATNAAAPVDNGQLWGAGGLRV